MLAQAGAVFGRSSGFLVMLAFFFTMDAMCFETSEKMTIRMLACCFFCISYGVF